MAVTGRLDHVNLRLVDSFEDLRDMESWFSSGPMQHGIMGIDVETSGLSLRHDRVRMIQFGDLNAGWALPWEWWSGYVQDMVRRYRGEYIMHNLPFDYPMIRKMGVDLPRGQLNDTLPLVKMIEPHLPAGLKPQASRHVDRSAGQAQTDLDEAIAKLGWAGVDFRFQPYWVYSALDPVITAWLWHLRKPVLEAQHPLAWQGWEVENAVQFVLIDMMSRGMPVDLEYAAQMRDKFLVYTEQAREWVRNEYGVSITSDAKLVEVFQGLGVEFTQKTPGGDRFSLDKEVLAGIDNPLAEVIRKYRKIDRLRGTYLEYILQNHVDGRIHSQIRSTGARTGRMSSAEPNLQNLPRANERDPAAKAIRDAYISQFGYTQIRADFDQVEMRMYAHLSNDPGLINAFAQPEDFFVFLAKMVFQDDTITKDHPYRQLVKGVGYGKIYGAGVEKQAHTAGVPFAQAKYANDKFDALFPGGRIFQNQIYAEAARNKAQYGESFVICPLSGRRHVADRGKEYALVNHLIQGMAAFFFKKKLVELSNTDIEPYMLMPVHDEIISDVPDEFLPEAGRILLSVLNDSTTFRVPITAGLTIGKRWGEKIEYNI